MADIDSPKMESFRQEDPFNFIKPEEFEKLGIDPADIPPGTFAAHKHPAQLPSRFGGNAYGFGLFEISDRLKKGDIRLIQSVSFNDPDDIKEHYQDINNIYKKIGLLIRLTNRGRPYYLIPSHFISRSLSNIKNKADEISKIIEFHRKKFTKENHTIGLMTNPDDPITEDLTLRFKEHQFVIISSLKEIGTIAEILDIFIITRDLYQIILMDNSLPLSDENLTKKQLEKYAIYMLGKIFKVLKPDGEIFVIANNYPVKTNKTTKVRFKTLQERKNFLLFSRIFKTKKRYQISEGSIRINIFDFERYLGGVYVEQEVIDRLLKGRHLDEISLKEIDNLPSLNYPLDDELAYDQQREWPKLLSVYFTEIFFKPMIPLSIKSDWNKRFSIKDYSPNYMRIYLGQKKRMEASLNVLKKDILVSNLAGCPLSLVAEYRDSYEYLINTLQVLNNIRDSRYGGISEVLMERLKEPLKNTRWRFSGLNDVLKLMSKIRTFEKIQGYLNPDDIEGPQTKILDNLEMLPFFGLTYGELREIFLIIVGHTTLGRILSGKMHEKTLKPVSDFARTHEHTEAINLLRYCCLMSAAETVASNRSDIKQEQIAFLFDLFDALVRVVTNRDLDWDRLMDEKISSMGGAHNKIIQKLLMMMNSFEFMDTWEELKNKGEMEKESLSDYDEKKLKNIENIIRLINIVEGFENRFLKDDPLLLPILYRKFLNSEFHGTGYILERLDSRFGFILLWIVVNLSRGALINFNPILANVKYREMDSHMKMMTEDAAAINTDYLDLETIKHFSEFLHESGSAFILNTGFRLNINRETQALDIYFIHMDENVLQLERLASKFRGVDISGIPVRDLEEIESRFSNLESFYQGHQDLLSQEKQSIKIPRRQQAWFRKAAELRKRLRKHLLEVLFKPQNIYDDLNLLFSYSPSILHFVLPEFLDLQKMEVKGKGYIKSPHVIEHILTSAKKLQALIRHKKDMFQNIPALHKLAQREFGPMAAGIVGLSDYQIETLEDGIHLLKQNDSLMDAIVKAFIFQDLGLIPGLREKYRDEIHSTDQAIAGSVLLDKLKIAERYNMDKKAEEYLKILVKHHDRLHHIVRGEFTIYALQEVVDFNDHDLFDAFYLSSFVMFSSLGEDLILEDLAARLFNTRKMCHDIIDGKTTFKDYREKLYKQKGRLFFALEKYQQQGLPDNTTPIEYLEAFRKDDEGEGGYIRAGRMIYSIERIFRLKGLRYIEFSDLVSQMLKIPLRFIYKKKNYYGVGYPTFEKELFEAQRVYNVIYNLPEAARSFVMEKLDTDEVRIFGFENVSAYLSYENMIKLLLLALLGSGKFIKPGGPVCLDFLRLSAKIEKRYEVVNHSLSKMPLEKIWNSNALLNQLFEAEKGLILRMGESDKVLIFDHIDEIDIPKKISHMNTITNVDQLKNYFHSSLQTLRKSPFHTDDYELQLEDAYDNRLKEITDLILEQTKRQMQLHRDLREVHNLFNDLSERSLEIGFNDDQRHRLNDLYELRKDQLKREKLNEIHNLLEGMNDINELKDYWDGIKYYLLDNRVYLGKAFEQIIARSFDEAIVKLGKR